MKHKKTLVITTAVLLIGSVIPIAFAATSPTPKSKPIAAVQAKVVKPVQKDTTQSVIAAPAAPTAPVAQPVSVTVVPTTPQTPVDWFNTTLASYSDDEKSCMVGLEMHLQLLGPDTTVQQEQTAFDYAINTYGTLCNAYLRLIKASPQSPY